MALVSLFAAQREQPAESFAAIALRRRGDHDRLGCGFRPRSRVNPGSARGGVVAGAAGAPNSSGCPALAWGCAAGAGLAGDPEARGVAGWAIAW